MGVRRLEVLDLAGVLLLHGGHRLVDLGLHRRPVRHVARARRRRGGRAGGGLIRHHRGGGRPGQPRLQGSNLFDGGAVQLHDGAVHARVQEAAEGGARGGGPPRHLVVRERPRQRGRRQPQPQDLVRHLGVDAVEEEDLDALLLRLLGGGDGGDALGHEAGGGALRGGLHGAARHRRGEGAGGQHHPVRARRPRDVRARPHQQHRAGEPRHNLFEGAGRLVQRASAVGGGGVLREGRARAGGGEAGGAAQGGPRLRLHHPPPHRLARHAHCLHQHRGTVYAVALSEPFPSLHAHGLLHLLQRGGGTGGTVGALLGLRPPRHALGGVRGIGLRVSLRETSSPPLPCLVQHRVVHPQLGDFNWLPGARGVQFAQVGESSTSAGIPASRRRIPSAIGQS
mmetsp:Transcript_27374/g.59819  ORF Transcript_27374/g.59819 Transcript_27374/m.59819 type:complete len:396 (-) Transcript_27374:841-2028(-)